MAGGRKAKPAPAPPSASRPTTTTTLILDNGAHTLKAGIVTPGSEIPAPRLIPNCIARDRSRNIYVGAELSSCRDHGEIQLRRPVERGFIVNWEAQKEIWDQVLFDERPGLGLGCDPSETRLILTEPPNGLPVLQTNCDQVVFEEYGFRSYYRGIAPSFNAYHDIQALFQTPEPIPTAANTPAEILLLIDSGYSHTTVTPLLAGQPLQPAIRRLDVGGKHLTNHLARLLSLRHFDMRNETLIVNDIKESACYVTADFAADLEATWKGTRGAKRKRAESTAAATTSAGGTIPRDYVLPDFHTRMHGALLDHAPSSTSRLPNRELSAAGGAVDEQDVLTLRNDRFTVPELLFSPLDADIRQPGLADLIRLSLEQLPTGLWPGLLANIVAVGGNTLFEGFVHRLQREVVQRFPDDCVVRVARPPDPLTSTWCGAANLASHGNIEKMAVTKEEYDELGSTLVARKLAGGFVSCLI